MICPIMPPIRISGRKAAMVVRLEENTGPAMRRAPSMAA